jgi:hypothetical protein
VLSAYTWTDYVLVSMLVFRLILDAGRLQEILGEEERRCS